MREADRYRSLIWPMLAVLAVLLLAVFFMHLASEVVEGDTRHFDMKILQAAQSLRMEHQWVAGTMRDFSGLGSAIVLATITIAVVGYLLLTGAHAIAGLVASSIASAALVVMALKAIFGRLRPDAAYADFLVSGLSFPSGHASMSAVVFLSLGALLASRRSRASERWYIISVACTLTLVVGLSRIALGVHWATDVLAGWAFGLAWAILWLLAAKFVATR